MRAEAPAGNHAGAAGFRPLASTTSLPCEPPHRCRAARHCCRRLLARARASLSPLRTGGSRRLRRRLLSGTAPDGILGVPPRGGPSLSPRLALVGPPDLISWGEFRTNRSRSNSWGFPRRELEPVGLWPGARWPSVTGLWVLRRHQVHVPFLRAALSARRRCSVIRSASCPRACCSTLWPCVRQRWRKDRTAFLLRRASVAHRSLRQ